MTTLIGNLTGDPELRFSTSGTAVLNGGIACNRRYQVNGEWQEETTFWRFAAFGQIAENLAASCNKGTRVILSGYFVPKEYKNAHGQDVKYNELKVTEGGPSCLFATCTVDRTARTFEKSERSYNTAPTTKTKASDGPMHQRAADEEAF